MPASPLPQSVVIKVDGAPLSSALFDKLTEVRVELSVGAAGQFTLRFLSDDGMAGEFKIGSEIAISFDNESLTPVEVIKGTVEGLAIDYEFDRRQLTVTGYDARRKISTAAAPTTYTRQSYSDILSAIANRSGLSPRIDSSLRSVVFDHVLQVESDLAFVHRIVTEQGLEWLVDGGNLIVRKRASTATVQVEFGERLRRLSARYTTSERPEDVTVTSWDPVQKQAIVERKNPETPAGSVPLESRNRKKAAAKRKATATKVATSLDAASAVATGIARRMASGDLVGRGETVGDPAIKPGVALEISGVNADWNGTYYVTAAEHIYRDGDPYLTRFTIGANDSSSLVDLLGAPGAPSTRSTGSARPLGQGVTIGIVTNVENGARNHAEVKVKLPYLGDIESEWLRVAMPGAGSQRGIMFMPEVNDEVLVAFEHGDPTRGYVIGSVWNGEDEPPVAWTSTSNHHLRSIKSKNGHLMTFSDGNGDAKQFVSIVLADGKTTLLLGHDKIEVVANSGKPIEVKNDRAKVVLAGNGDIKLEGQNITIKAQQKINVEGLEIATKSQTGTKIEALTFEAKAQTTAKLEGTAMAEVKGGMVKIN